MSTTTLSNQESPATVGRESSSLLGPSHGDLVLRMTNGPHAGRVVRLSSSKCSIGSAADCTLRLRGAGIDPVHCVILRGTRQTIIRRWSDDTRLNDRRFDDMPLQHGDRLTLGSIEMQVMAVPGEIREAAQAARRIDLELAAATGRLERLTERLDLSNRQGRRRLRAVLAKLRKYQLRLTEVESRRSRLTQEQEDLAAERTRLQTAQQTLERSRGELELEGRRLAENEGTIAERRAELERRTAALLEREADLTTRGRELTDRTTALAVEQARLQAAQADFEQLRGTQDRESRRLAALEADFTARQAELERHHATLDTQAADLMAREQALTDRAAQLAESERSLSIREATLTAQIEDLRKQAADLTRRETEMSRRESEVAARCEALKNHWSTLTEGETKLERDRAALTETEAKLQLERNTVAVQEAKLQLERNAVAEQEAKLQLERNAVAEQEAKLQLERNAVAEQEAKLQLDRNSLAEQEYKIETERSALVERERQLAERPLPAPITETKIIVDTAAVERAEQLQRALDEARAELAAQQAELVTQQAELVAREAQRQADLHAKLQAEWQTKYQTEQAALQEVRDAEALELSDRRAAVEAEAADLTARRATVELAARTVERWSTLVEEWAAAEPIATAAPIAEVPPVEVMVPDPAVVAQNEEMAAALEQAESRLLNHRLDIEKLEAELQTWRDEAQLWKSRFDEATFAPPQAMAPIESVDVAADQAELKAIEQVESEVAADSIDSASIAAETMIDETVAEPMHEAEPVEQVEAAAEYHEPVAYEEPTEDAVAEAPTTVEAPTHEVKSESAADVLRRLGLTAALEDEPVAAGAPQQQARPLPTPPAPTPKPAAAEHHEGEESLDAYMQQLFQRLGVKQGAGPAPEAKPQPQHSSPSMNTSSMSAPRQIDEAPKSEQPAPAAAPLPLLQPGEFKARSSAAERRSDLSALRELANFQAKTAIARNQIVRKSSKSKGKQTIGLASLAIGLCSGYAYFVQGIDYAFYGMFACIGVAVLLLMQSIKLKLSASKGARSLDDVIQQTAERGATKEVGK